MTTDRALAPLEDDDFEVIEPPVDLRRRARVMGTGPLDLEAIAAAERALESLSVRFAGWLQEEVGSLLDARAGFAADRSSAAALDRLFGVAHDLKGQGATLGFPLVGAVAGSLCTLIEGADPVDVPAALVDHHVDAIAAMTRENASGAAHPVADALVAELRRLSHEAAAARTARQAS